MTTTRARTTTWELLNTTTSLGGIQIKDVVDEKKGLVAMYKVMMHYLGVYCRCNTHNKGQRAEEEKGVREA